MKKKSLEKLRKEIDKLDGELLVILAKRADKVFEIGNLKKEKGVLALDKKRWKEVLQSRTSKGANLNHPKEFIKKIFSVIHKHSLEIERNL